jgi:hypothetical protein
MWYIANRIVKLSVYILGSITYVVNGAPKMIIAT